MHISKLWVYALLLLLFSCHEKDTLFVALPASQTHIDFVNNLEKHKAFGLLYYLYYYNGGGVATGDINGDGLPDIYFTANKKSSNKLYINKGNFQFEDVTAKAGVAGTSDWCTGATMADVNGDGKLDIYVSALGQTRWVQGRNELFINNGNGTFTESAKQFGLDFSGYTTQSAFFDYDHDGDLDCFILTQSLDPVGNIVDTSYRRKFDAYAGDYLLRNDISTTGKFTDVSASAGIIQSSLSYGLGISVADMNNDGWEDIYIGNDFHENDYYYVNNGNGTFTESGAKHFNHYSRFSMGNDIADYNNDGQPDVVTVDMLPDDEKVLKTYGSDENPDIYQFKIVNNGYQYQYSKNCLQRNNGDGSSFSEVGLLAGISATDWSWCPLLADFDNDGNKDLFISSGIVKRPVDLDYVKFISNLYIKQALDKTDKLDDTAMNRMPDGASHPFLFKGNGIDSFKEVSEDWGTGDMSGYFNGAAYADLDNDGNLDLIINQIGKPAVILKNNAPKRNELTIAFKGEGMNTFGVGCKAYLFANGRLQYQQLMLTRGFQSSCEPRLHFGLDTLKNVDSLLIVWPNQRYQLLKNIPANKPLIVDEKNAADTFQYATFFPSKPALFVVDSMNIQWQHKENNFWDYNVQYLIPHSESTRGPKLAVGDINGDGLDDFYACGAAGQPGALMVQQKGGFFVAIDTAVFSKDAGCEDVDALFFDANGDGKQDLYVVSGGNEFTGNNPLLLDRLYINDGNGHFTKSTDALPPVFANKSCVAAADIDHDGDMDIFAGNLADAINYGLPQTSFLYLNDGKGHFSLADGNKIALSQIGMVTAAAFTDVNKDSWQDLVVAGEWMPITVFINKGGIFEKQAIPNSTGWWQTLYIDDVNRDGQADILAGNWGWNNKFWSGKDGPVKLYVGDYDLSGRVSQLMSYTLHGKEYPFLAKDEVERPLPKLRKHYLLYTEYAGVPMKEVFYGWIDTVKPIIAERLGSAVCLGNGKGSFTIQNLPAQLQAAPVFAFQKIASSDSENNYLLGGNFFDVIPYEGRYDAQPLDFFSVDSKNRIADHPQQNLLNLKGQIRDIKSLRTAKGNVLVVAQNNGPLLFYKYNLIHK
ncbi:RNA-binding protein [Ilyomonas limi]|uniref:RNA-binding protein n=1 Tax=Ilyomonas limi TaxID=2575867 RepID=A0A4U3KQ60_9BACT|nr:VCBS repeat-containing protein [Ilyomonas limi]TKK64425.1 RNA-binding protein [Ilyomonas limi]